MTEPSRPQSVTVAVVLGFVQVGLSTFATVAMLLIASALASAMEVEMGDVVWAIAIAQLFVVALLVFGTVQLRRGAGRTPYFVAAGLHLVNCVLWLILFFGSGNPAYPLIPLLFAAVTAVGVVYAAKPVSSG